MTSEAVTAALIVGVVVGCLGRIVLGGLRIGSVSVGGLRIGRARAGIGSPAGSAAGGPDRSAAGGPAMPLWLSLTVATVSTLLVTVAMQMVRITEDPPAAAVRTGVGWDEIVAQGVVAAMAIAAIVVVAASREHSAQPRR